MPHAIPALPLPNDIRTLARVARNPSKFLLELSCMAGPIGMLNTGVVRIACINEPSMVHEVLVEKAAAFRKMPAVKTLKAFTGDGLLVNDSDVWAKHRRLAAPAFHHQRIIAYQRVVADATHALLASWRDGAVIDAEPTFKQLTLDIIGRALFTTRLEDIAPGIGHDIDVALNYVNRLAGVGMLPLGRALVTNGRSGRAAIKRVDRAVRSMISRRRNDGRDHGDLLSMFLQSRTTDGLALDDDEVRDEVITMFVAGHETVATVLTWLVYLLARHQDSQARLAKESAQVLRGEPPSFESLARLPYALQAYKEAMRLYPGGFTIGRQATRDVDIGAYIIPAGAWVMVSPYAIQRNPRSFAEPEKFEPERFSASAERSIPKGAYLPFGLGARVCIGSQFALMEGQTIIAALAQRVRFEDATAGVADILPMIALSPDRPIRLRVRLRDGRAFA
jgi:cytochrome P450